MNAQTRHVARAVSIGFFSWLIPFVAGFAAFPACQAIPFADLLEELPEREHRLFHSGVDSLAFEVSKKINAIESI